MKGYAERRGVQSRLIYDAESGEFQQRHVPHAFGTTLESAAAAPPEAEVIALPKRRAAARQPPAPEGQGVALGKRSISRAG